MANTYIKSSIPPLIFMSILAWLKVLSLNLFGILKSCWHKHLPFEVFEDIDALVFASELKCNGGVVTFKHSSAIQAKYKFTCKLLIVKVYYFWNINVLSIMD